PTDRFSVRRSSRSSPGGCSDTHRPTGFPHVGVPGAHRPLRAYLSVPPSEQGRPGDPSPAGDLRSPERAGSSQGFPARSSYHPSRRTPEHRPVTSRGPTAPTLLPAMRVYDGLRRVRALRRLVGRLPVPAVCAWYRARTRLLRGYSDADPCRLLWLDPRSIRSTEGRGGQCRIGVVMDGDW